ncbi:MAG TPA: hypothetical protein VK079_03020 [Bacillota bacterium]|nr:hypothetical protein [Bacillota bacterium]
MNSKIKRTLNFSFTIAVITFVLAAIFSVISSSILNHVTWVAGGFVVLVIIIIGIVFDMLGIASAAADEAPFHAMASEKVYGAKEAIAIIKNADKFSSFCNDVIGDISGIVSGTATAIVLMQLAYILGYDEGSSWQLILSVTFTSLVAALTVGGKAIGKFFAINSSTQIMIYTGKTIAFLESKLKIKIVSKLQKKRTK